MRSWKCVDLPLLLGSVCVVFPEDRSWLRRKLRCCAPESGTCGRTSRRGCASSTIAYVECAHRASAAASLQMTWALGGQPTPCLCHQKLFFKQLLLPCTVLIPRKVFLRSLFGTGATISRVLRRAQNRYPHGNALLDTAMCRKTLQTLALLWTVLKQGPRGVPLIKRAIIVTPATITQNWAAEVSHTSSITILILCISQFAML